MILKRIYHQDKLVRGKDGEVMEAQPGAVKGVLIKPELNLGSGKVVKHSKEQRFSPRFVMGGMEEGWLAMANGKITITPLEGKPVVYKIVRGPGVYCCHDGKKLDAGNATAAAYVQKHFAGKKSPDPENPSGYRVNDYYDCVQET